MAGDVTVAVVSGQINIASTGFEDFTKSGFGTPKACIILLGRDVNDDTSVATESRMSIGLSDFTDDYCITHQDEDASAKVDCDALKSNTKSYVILDASASVVVDGGATTVTDGVRLTNTTNSISDRPRVTVIMFGGADLTADIRSSAINSSADGTATITHASFTDGNDKLIFFIGSDISAEDSASSGINNSFGVCHVTGNDAGGYTFSQRAMGWASDHANVAGSPAAIISDEHVLDMITETGGEDWALEVTGFSSSGNTITVTSRDVGPGANMEVYSLALDLDDRKAKVGTALSPTTGSTWTPSVSLGFTPQYVGLMIHLITVASGIQTGTASGALGISSNTGAGEETCHSWYNEDNAGTTNTNNLFRSRAIDLRLHSAASVVQDHSHSSFNSGDWTYTINTENNTTADDWGFWAIEEVTSVFDPDADAFRFYSDGTESGSSPKADEDTNIELDPTGDAQFHIRFRVQNQSAIAGAATDDFALEVNKNSTSYAAVTGASSNVQSDTASGLTADGASTNRATNGIADGTGSFVAGEQEETNGVIENIQLTASNFTEHVWACKLIDTDLGSADTLDFRVTLNAGSPGMTNSVTPRISTPGGSITIFMYHHMHHNLDIG